MVDLYIPLTKEISEKKLTEIPNYSISASGYNPSRGMLTSWVIRVNNEKRWRRVMIRQFDNDAAVCFVRILKQDYSINDPVYMTTDDLDRLASLNVVRAARAELKELNELVKDAHQDVVEAENELNKCTCRHHDHHYRHQDVVKAAKVFEEAKEKLNTLLVERLHAEIDAEND